MLENIIWKTQEYLSGNYGLISGVGAHGIFWSVAPHAISKLSDLGIKLLIVALVLSAVQSRAWFIFLPFLILEMKLPGFFEDRKFWLIVFLFSFIQLMWIWYNLVNINWWRYIS